jgi:hypothetical protein
MRSCLRVFVDDRFRTGRFLFGKSMMMLMMAPMLMAVARGPVEGR